MVDARFSSAEELHEEEFFDESRPFAYDEFTECHSDTQMGYHADTSVVGRINPPLRKISHPYCNSLRFVMSSTW